MCNKPKLLQEFAQFSEKRSTFTNITEIGINFYKQVLCATLFDYMMVCRQLQVMRSLTFASTAVKNRCSYSHFYSFMFQVMDVFILIRVNV